ncbi:uncharacterized protein ANIA_08388 [Aspergillus nidulans FGSC A4]|uniref:Nucleoside phosphorylase domain-containing protein n=1 Tax=Emericella nidulans (strain FGSC A4 / ATCC 38163 / CBS 112.46 / NRRL 194 / M139) TaxID=227321 RepID=C8VE87_EMENI|nr:hypothetical protein [Aspergillus nidulans FGSC A4]CBF80439.1 TPA: conserved hypothetical protein [Aspergillus nidulans FGSC A4]
MLLSIVRALSRYRPPGIYWIRCIQEGLPVGPGDDYLFHAGEIHGHNVVIAAFAAGQPYGTNSATSLASHVKKFFPNLWFGLLVGVSTGLPNFSCSPPRDIRLSNVIVAWSPPGGDYPAIIPYGLGKQKGDVGLSCCAMDIPCLRQDALWAPQLVRSRRKRDAQVIEGYYRDIADTARKFPDRGQENDLLYLPGENLPVLRQHRPDAERTRVWYGSIGSGDKLLKSSRDRDEISDKYNVIGLEMEAAGVLNVIPVGVIRGVCDYGTSKKKKKKKKVKTGSPMQRLRDSLATDPETELRHIEATKGGLLDSSFRWVLENAEFQKWHSSPPEPVALDQGRCWQGQDYAYDWDHELVRQVQSEPLQSIAYCLCQIGLKKKSKTNKF